MNLHIPIPCHENWDTMLPRDQGRHCEVCCKTVVDFTQMQPAEITDYMQKNVAQKICGRFTQSQLSQTPGASFYQLAYRVIDANFFSYAKKWLAIVALCFIFSQNADAQKKPTSKPADTACIKNKPIVMGKLLIQEVNAKQKPGQKPSSKKPKKTPPLNHLEKPGGKNLITGEVITVGMVRRD